MRKSKSRVIRLIAYAPVYDAAAQSSSTSFFFPFHFPSQLNPEQRR